MSIITREEVTRPVVKYGYEEDCLIVETINQPDATVKDVVGVLNQAGFLRTWRSIRRRIEVLRQFETMDELKMHHGVCIVR